MKLKNFNEVVGTLTDVKIKDGKTIIGIEIKKEIETPSHVFLNNELYFFKGKKIGIINIDGKLKIRKIKEKT